MARARNVALGERFFVYHGRGAKSSVQQQASDVEFRLSDLQTQIDRLSLALHQWHHAPEDARPTEERLSQLLERCAETLSRVSAIDEHHAQVVAKLEARLSDWSFVESRLEHDSDQRIRQFEQIIGHEWEALRKLHEEPAKQLREQAASLGETCVAAANLALRSFERAEARIAALEAGLEGRMAQLASDLQAAVAELRSGAASRPAALPAHLPPFPLEGVMRIHDELRKSDDAADTPSPSAQLPPADGSSRTLPPKLTTPLPEERFADRMASLARAVVGGEDEARARAARTDGMQRVWRAAIIAAAVVILGGGALLFRLQRQVDAKLNDAAVRVAAAEREADTATELANRRIAETQEEAGRTLAEARRTALQAQITSSVLAAPDLTRISLAGGPAAPGAYAQVLWSRSRGLVLSASRVPAPRQGATYQLWLLTSAGAVSAGLFAPDSAGRATLAIETPPSVLRPVVSAVVTLEPSDGRPQPTGPRVLTRAQ
jgi:hypothetical protein